MTFYRYEVVRIVCDVCGDMEEESLNPEYENPIETEAYFIESLKEAGWVYLEESGEHLCPECAKNYATDGGEE